MVVDIRTSVDAVRYAVAIGVGLHVEVIHRPVPATALPGDARHRIVRALLAPTAMAVTVRVVELVKRARIAIIDQPIVVRIRLRL